ncbi:MAG: S-layer homology domain-containing protein [Chloroflexota bacterium]|nr:S-layer homology domain-containing protein [Chloroflexota bacterium]
MPVSFFGMNLYLTGLERSLNQASTLGALAAQGGVKWSREELSWANIEPNSKGSYNWGPYDSRLAYDFNNNIDVVGMLLTTPRWASTNPGANNWYWYEPGNFNDYFDYVRAAVTRWHNQIHVWEIWNEPNAVGTWSCLNNCDRAADYARLLQGAYAAVKAVDPNARVLIGGLYVHDTNNEGLAFLDQVVTASGGAINFDALSIHTYMSDRVPESTAPTNVIQNFQYRLNIANDWINSHNGRPAEIWITEDGRSTCNGCANSWSEDQQANMLARMYGIALAGPRVTQFDYFQFEDKFNNPADLYGGMSIVRDDYSTKPAYNAYKTAQSMLDGATLSGMGPQMIHGSDPQQPASSDYIAFDYKFTRGSANLHMVWRVNDTATVNYPVDAQQVDVLDRDGGTTHVSASGGTIPLTISQRPQYIVSVGCGTRFSDVCADYWAYSYIECLASRNIVSGYADGTFGPGNLVTRGQLAKVVSLASGDTSSPTNQTYQDVPTSSPFYLWIQRLTNRGYISGYTCGGPGEPCVAPTNRPYFRPGSYATRGQIAKIVSNAASFNEAVSGQTFEDVPATNTFYLYVQRLSARGILAGYACGGAGEPCVAPGNRAYFRWNTNTSRAQISKIVSATWFSSCGAASKP